MCKYDDNKTRTQKEFYNELTYASKFRKIDELIIHCSASGFGSVNTIDSWHKAVKFKCIGYHLVLTNGKNKFKDATNEDAIDGSLYFGRLFKLIGAHTTEHNINTIGLCLIGNSNRIYDINNIKKVYTEKQITTLIQTIETFVKFCKDNNIVPKISGHNEYTDHKVCPGFNVKEFLEYYNITI